MLPLSLNSYLVSLVLFLFEMYSYNMFLYGKPLTISNGTFISFILIGGFFGVFSLIIYFAIFCCGLLRE